MPLFQPKTNDEGRTTKVELHSSFVVRPISLDRKTRNGSLDAGDTVDLIHHQPTDSARVGGFDRHNNVVGASHRVSSGYPWQPAQRRDHRTNLACLGLDQHICPGVHGVYLLAWVPGGTQRAASLRLCFHALL